MNEPVRAGWVIFRHKVTGEMRELNPYRVEAIRALEGECHPRNPLAGAWEQVPVPPQISRS